MQIAKEIQERRNVFLLYRTLTLLAHYQEIEQRKGINYILGFAKRKQYIIKNKSERKYVITHKGLLLLSERKRFVFVKEVSESTVGQPI
jgi:predicted transcriptional regulator